MAPAGEQRVAQVGPPVQLGPGQRPPPTRERPVPPAATPAPARPAPTETGPQEPPVMPGPVVIDQLKALEPDSVGLLEDGQGGLGAGMWRGTSRATVERLLPLIPAGMRSQAGRDLARRLLMTRATAPQGQAAAGTTSLLGLRAERLLEMGEERSAVSLLRLGPPQGHDEVLARTEVEALFLDNDRAAACDRAQNAVRVSRQVYWLEAQAFCLALAGEQSRAVVMADLLREQHEDLEPVFFAAIDALGGDAGIAVDRLANLNGLHLAMARTAKLKLPESVADVDRPVLLSTIVRSPNIALEVRLRAAERAASFGILTAEELGEFYLGIPFTPDELRQPTSGVETSWGPRRRALLIRAAAGASSPTVAAEILRQGLRFGREKGGFDAIVAGALRPLSSIQPTAELGWFARDAARVLFANGRREQALAWVRVAEQTAAASPEGRAALDELRPLQRLAAPEQVASLGPAAATPSMARPGEDGAAATRRTFVLRTLLEAIERTTGSTTWSAYVGADAPKFDASPDPVLWQALSAAARHGRLGETVLLSLIALGPGGTSTYHPLMVSAVIDALRAIGLEKEARAIALEAAVAAGA